MHRERFEQLVAQAVDELPEEFLERLDNVDVVVEDQPSAAQIRHAHIGRSESLLGLYEGIPITERHSNYGLVPPDKITIFQRPVESGSRTEDEIRDEVQRVVKHEIAHHFGISDARLDELEQENSD